MKGSWDSTWYSCDYWTTHPTASAGIWRTWSYMVQILGLFGCALTRGWNESSAVQTDPPGKPAAAQEICSPARRRAEAWNQSHTHTSGQQERHGVDVRKTASRSHTPPTYVKMCTADKTQIAAKGAFTHYWSVERQIVERCEAAKLSVAGWSEWRNKLFCFVWNTWEGD